ncbi:SiaB family protein kinase [Rapidithrix thailandica]|uniref:SiaB family protein kinase n=1 Tax=Rapidithrix thailandica TaxID=413964 RepID=A0AAW9RYV6_9BACT
MTSSIQNLSLYDYYNFTNRSSVVISYKGPITDVLMAEISRDIRDKFSDNPRVSRKVFSVFMELAQNMLFYSSEKVFFANRKDSVGTLLLTDSDNAYKFSCGNLVKNEYVDELLSNCAIINSLDKEELRKYKREQRNKPQGERSKGAGIGLIHVALLTGQPLDIEVREVDNDYSFFSLTVTITKTV